MYKRNGITINTLILSLVFVLSACGSESVQTTNSAEASSNMAEEVIIDETEANDKEEKGTRANPYNLSEGVKLKIEAKHRFNDELATWELSNLETYKMRSIQGTADIENLMFDCSLIEAENDNNSYGLNDFVYITQVDNNMAELDGYSIFSIALDEDGNPVYQKENYNPTQFTGSTIKAGIIPYSQGLSKLDKAPEIAYYIIYYKDSNGNDNGIWIKSDESKKQNKEEISDNEASSEDNEPDVILNVMEDVLGIGNTMIADITAIMNDLQACSSLDDYYDIMLSSDDKILGISSNIDEIIEMTEPYPILNKESSYILQAKDSLPSTISGNSTEELTEWLESLQSASTNIQGYFEAMADVAFSLSND